MRALAGAFALVERGDDRAVKRHRAGMVAHARRSSAPALCLVGAHQIHQARARPIGIGVEAGLVGFLALFAIAGEGRVDQPLVVRREVIVGDAEPLAHAGRKIGDEDVGLGGKPMQHRLTLGLAEIERETPFVAGFQQPREIMLAARIARQIRQVAIGIARARRFDLDHVGAEIRQHGGGCGGCDETRAIQNLEAFKDAFFHDVDAPVTFVGFSCGLSR